MRRLTSQLSLTHYIKHFFLFHLPTSLDLQNPKRSHNMTSLRVCTKSSCFFCIMKEQDSSIRRGAVQDYLKGVPFLDDEELILVVRELWNVAMTRPDDEELPSLGIFECMTNLIKKAIHDRSWLLKHQNIYIPYYAAHIVGSYTMNRVDLAVRAVDSGVVLPLMELLRGKMSWVERRVAVRALGHLASYERTFKAIAVYEEEVVKLAMNLASSCLEEVYTKFVGVEDKSKRVKYHRDLLTRGVGGVEMENRKAEEWASQLQCWSIHLLNCFAVKERSLDLMCRKVFLKELSEMWGGLANHTSPAGIGLIRILCYSKVGRESISRSKHAIENLCNISRSSDDWQYMGIDCLLLLLKDHDTRYRIIDVATELVDLIELRNLGNRRNVGEAITRALVHDCKYYQSSKIKNACVQRSLEEIWVLKIERRKREQFISSEKLEERRAMVKLIKQQGNHKFLVGDLEEAMVRYSEALEICPLRYRNERVVLHSNRAQCHLLLRDPDGSISDATRALCLSSPPNSHGGSLWTRSQAYDMKGMAKESLMDCIIFINVCIKSNEADRLKLPYYAVRMISKQMDSTWLFRSAQNKAFIHHADNHQLKYFSCNEFAGLSTILEEPLAVKDGIGRKKGKRVNGRSNKSV